MHTQYVANQSSSCLQFDAAQSQPPKSVSISYLLQEASCSFPQGYTQVTYPQNVRGHRREVGVSRVENRDRRLTCLRASRAFAPFPCLPSWQHVAATTTQVTLKNSWSLTRFRLPLSQPSAANTTNSRSGQAFAPVPPYAALVRGAS